MSGTIIDRLEKLNYQLLPDTTLSDVELVEAVRDIYDAAINSGLTIPPETSFPVTVMGVTVDWDADNQKFVLARNSTILRDNLVDNTRPHAIDMNDNTAFSFYDDEYMVLSGGDYDDELLLLDETA